MNELLAYATSFGFSVLKQGKPLCCSAFTEHSWSPELGSKTKSTKGRTSGARGGRCKVGFKLPLQLLESVLLYKLKYFLVEMGNLNYALSHGSFPRTPYVCQNDCCKLSCSTISSFHWNVHGSVPSAEVCTRAWNDPTFPVQFYQRHPLSALSGMFTPSLLQCNSFAEGLNPWGKSLPGLLAHTGS